jgi:uncharacterized membrane protein YfcA
VEGFLWYQYGLIALIFVWSGFVRSGLGFGGAALSLPFLLLIDDRPIVYLVLIAVHLLFFSALTVTLNNRGAKKNNQKSTIDWAYIKYALSIMIIPKLVGVFGLITLPSNILSVIIFFIISVYAVSYILNRPFSSNSKKLDWIFLILGGYISGTSLIGAPLIIAVFVNRVKREQLRDTLFVLWFILVSIKMSAFIYVGIDLQLIHHLWLLPCAAIGHVIGLRFHDHIIKAESPIFFRLMGSLLLIINGIGLWRILPTF